MDVTTAMADVRRPKVPGSKIPPLSSSSPDFANLLRLFANFFPGTLSRQSLLHPALRARLQVEGMTLHFLDDIFGDNLAFEPTKGIFH
jgi:hypothetical protein